MEIMKNEFIVCVLKYVLHILKQIINKILEITATETKQKQF